MMVEMNRNTHQLLNEQILQFSFLPYFFNICKNKGLIKNNLDEKIMKKEGDYQMSKSKRQKEREWTVRKQDQNPHGKVKSLKEISNEVKP